MKPSKPIRSYILNPERRCLDHRTGQTADVAQVLDGNIDVFLKPALAAKITTQHHWAHKRARKG